MTTREAIKFRFKKKTVTTEESGDGQVYHYFTKDVGDITFMISKDSRGVWLGSIFDFGVQFYNANSFKDVIKAVEKGDWNG